MNRRGLAIAVVLVAAVLFFAVNILSNAALRGARVDLTQHRLYTLTQGSRNVAKAVSEPIRLRLYFSEKTATGVPQFKAYGQRVRELLEEYALSSGGKIKLEMIDPEPFSEAEDEAAAAELVSLPVGPGGERLFFGLVGTNSTDAQEIIRFFNPGPDSEQFLEYDITRLIYSLSNPTKKAIGVISALPMDGMSFDPMTGQPRQAQVWQVITQMRGLFEVKMLGTDPAEIPADIGVLLVVHPKGASDETLYKIDQYVMNGGRLLAFVDPNCEVDDGNGMFRDPMARMRADRSSNLDRLTAAWGLKVMAGKVAGDRGAATRVRVGSDSRGEAVDYVCWLDLGPEQIARQDAVTGQLKRLRLATAGVLEKTNVEGVEITPLIQTGTDSQAIDQQRVQFIPDPKAILKEFVPGGAQLLLGARISGKVKSAFPDGPPPPAPNPDGTTPPPPPPGSHLAESSGPVNVLLVADVDMLADPLWIEEDRLMGQVLLGYRKSADNGDLLLSALDNLTGSQDLISVRARGQFSRPFERVRKIEAAAQQKYRAEQDAADQKIQDAQARLNQMQKNKAEGSELILTPEQQAEIQKLQEDLLAARKQQRDVAHSMRRDIERLGTQLQVINTGAIPAAVCALALGLGAYRAARRRADRGRAA